MSPPLLFSMSDENERRLILLLILLEFESVNLFVDLDVIDLVDLDVIDLVCCCGDCRCLLTGETAPKQSVPAMVGLGSVGNFGEIDSSVWVSNLGEVG